MAGNIKDIKIRIGGDVQKLNAAIRSSTKETSALQKELRATEKLLQFKPGNTELLAQKQQILGSAITQTKDKLETLKSAQVQLDEQFKKGEITQEQYAEQSRALSREIAFTEQSLYSLEKKVGSSENKWRNLGIKMEAAGEKIQKVGDKMSSVGSKLTMGLSAPLAALGGLAAKAAIDFESAFAGVEKTVNATDEQLAELKQGIRDMAKEIPASAAAISEVGEAAGQLGIEVPNILSFTRTMIDLGEATNLSATEAATSLAKFANITQMSQSDFDKLGSTIVELGNNLATTEADIVAMATNLASAGSQVGMSEAQIVSFAAALSSVGMEAQAGGTSMSKAMIQMQLAVETGNESLEKFASVAGMSSAEFQKAFKDDAASAITAFIQGLSTAEERGMSAIAVLDDMGITETRLRDSLLRAAGASDLFAESIQMGTAAWSENNALTDEAAKRYETTASKLAIFKNKAVDLGISFGEMILPSLIKVTDKISALVEGFNKLSPATKKIILTLAGIAAAAGPVLTIGGKLVKTVGTITKGLGGLAIKLGTTAAPLAATSTAMSGVGTAAATGGAGIAKFGGMLAGLASPAGIAVAAIAGIGIATGLIVKELNERVVPEVDIFGESVSESTKEALGAFMELSNEGSAQMQYLASSGTVVTQQMAIDVTSNITAMKDQVLAALEEQKTNGLVSMEELVAGLVGYSAEEKQALVDNAIQGVDEKIKAIEDGEVRIQEILANAVSEKRALNDAEYQEYVTYQKMLQDAGIVALTETQEELKSIRTEMKNQAAAITAEQGSEMLKISAKNRNEMKAAAEEEYKTREEMLKTSLNSEDEAIKQAAEDALKVAKEEKNTKLKLAEEQHTGVIEELQSMGLAVSLIYDTQTGEMLTKWESANSLIAQANSARSANFIQTEEEITGSNDRVAENSESVGSKISAAFEAMQKDVNAAGKKVSDGLTSLPGKIKSAFSSIGSFFSRVFTEAWKAIKDAFAGVKTFFDEKLEEIKGVFSIENFKKIFVDGIGGGLTKAKDAIAKKAGEVWKAIKTAMSKEIKVVFGFGGDGGGYGGKGGLGWANAPVTQGFGKNGHKGVDFGVSSGTPIGSPVGGKVVVSKDLANSYGKYVVIADGANNYHYFAHLSKRSVPVGAMVPRGGLIGYSGNTGNSTGPHLHYEVRYDNIYTNQVNPWKFLRGFATGGFPMQGEVFKANENGIEMMGKMGKKPVVANNMQIVEGISQAVQRGMASAMSHSNAGYVDNSTIIVNIEGDASSVDERRITKAVEKALYTKQRRESRSRGLVTI